MLTLGPGARETVKHSSIPWKDSKYWWPHDPQLYLLRVEMEEDGKLIDFKDTRFGFRQFQVEGNHFELNGRKINLRAESFEFVWHEGFSHGPSTSPAFSTKELTVDVQKKLLEAYKGLNLNALRFHKTGVIDATYDFCDELGLLVIDEVPFWQTQQRTDARAKDNFQEWVRRWIMERRNHASVIMWSICNECWTSAIPEFTYTTAKEMDPTRPAYHQGIRDGDFEGDERSVHYTGGYPFNVFNARDLYGFYTNDADKPKSEGESFCPEAWPVKDPDGSIRQGKRSKRGDFKDQDLVSQAQWVRGVCRFVRAMRFAGLADSRSYMNWPNCFEAIEEDIRPEWKDLSAPEIKPVVLHRPLCETFTGRHPEIKKGDGYDYWKNTHAPVAVFDIQWDKDNRLGVEPKIYEAGDVLERDIVVYNDALSGGQDLIVGWEAGAVNPKSRNRSAWETGSVQLSIPYGESKKTTIRFTVPEAAKEGQWLMLTLKASKNGKLLFTEDNRLGAIGSTPAPRIDVVQDMIDLGNISSTKTTLWKKIKLVNRGGGLSEKWKVFGVDDTIVLVRTEGNLRGEEEIYFQIYPQRLVSGEAYSRTLTFTGEHGSQDSVTIRFKTVDNG